MLQEPYLVPVPAVFNFKVRKGAKQICVECSWPGLGWVEIKIHSPTKVYTEGDMQVTEGTSIGVGPVTTSYQSYKRCVVSIPAPQTDETWRLELSLAGIAEYQLNIEVS